MKNIIILTLIAVATSGCLKEEVTTGGSWDVSVVTGTNQPVELHTLFEKSTTTQTGPKVGFNIQKVTVRPLILEPNISVEDKSSSMQRKATYNPADKTVIFELSIDDEGVTYSTNGVITIR